MVSSYEEAKNKIDPVSHDKEEIEGILTYCELHNMEFGLVFCVEILSIEDNQSRCIDFVVQTDFSMKHMSKLIVLTEVIDCKGQMPQCTTS